jgi:hypothetical protein
MHHVLPGENSATRVQQESVQAVFKPIGVNKTCHHAQEKATDGDGGMRNKLGGDEDKDYPGQGRSEQIISLDSKPLGNRSRPNFVIRKHFTTS